MEIGERIRHIREVEGLSQEDFAVEIGMKYQTLRKYETGRTTSIGSEQLSKITTHPRFEKYTLWLMTGKTETDVGQISPEMFKEHNAG